jgi:hypothetical protein
MKRWFGKLGIGTVFVLIGVAALAGGAFSLATRDSSEATARDGAGGGPPWMRDGDRPSNEEIEKWRKEKQERRKEFESELGKELGKSQEEVHAAFRNVMKNHLDEAVKDGDLTRKQADNILACFDGKECDPPFRHGPGGPPGGGPPMGGPPMGGPGPPM